MVFHMPWKTAVEPVKCTPAKVGRASRSAVIAAGSPAMKFTTPGGSPAASKRRMM
jgi:hypothetical protein